MTLAVDLTARALRPARADSDLPAAAGAFSCWRRVRSRAGVEHGAGVVCVYVCVLVCVCARARACMRVRARLCVCACACACVRVCKRVLR